MRAAALAIGMGALLGMPACGGDAETSPDDSPFGNGTRIDTEAERAASDGAPPHIERIVLEPSEPRAGERVRARVEAVDPEGERLRFEYEWRLAGELLEQGTSPSLALPRRASRGARLEAKVVAIGAGERRSAPASASARIGNSPPQVQDIAIEPPGGVTGGTDVTAHPRAVDYDGDALSFDYRWMVSGRGVSVSGATLPSDHFGSGDEIVVQVAASDGQARSDWFRSGPIPVENAPPRITSSPGSLEGGRFEYAVEAEDPDGDTTFRYRLVEAPAGMELDRVDGTLRWTPREGQAGRHSVKIEVSDAKGAHTTQSFTIDLAFTEGGSSETAPAAAE